ncbi:MAG: TRAP transporter substrate-binding protein DctP [Polyangiaceae bacterium]|nr:TRAP transporter substrate-binding protein DctP [Polyangiaceae bacterium]
MLLRTKLGALLGAVVALCGVTAVSDASAAEISIGTLAPKHSPWGKVFRVWKEAVEKKTDGKLVLKFFFNGQQGDEAAMVGKIRSGQLAGAAITSVGLGKIYQPMLALQMPGLFDTWEGLDKARDDIKDKLAEGAKGEGFLIAGWGDVGLAHTFTKGVEIRVPTDLRGTKPYRWRDDIIASTIYDEIKEVNGVPLGVPELLPALDQGTVNVFSVPALAAEQLQWASRADHVSENVIAVGIGALVFSQKAIDELDADVREVLISTGRKAGKMLTDRIRAEDAEAFGRIKSNLSLVTLTADEIGQWSELFKKVRARLAQGTFPAALVSRLEQLAGK